MLNALLACSWTGRAERKQQTSNGAYDIGRWDNATKLEVKVQPFALQPTASVRTDLTIFEVVGSYAIWLTQLFE